MIIESYKRTRSRLGVDIKVEQANVVLSGNPDEISEAAQYVATADAPSAILRYVRDGDQLKMHVEATGIDAVKILRVLYKNEFIECEHEFVEHVDTDDTLSMGADGEIHARINPDSVRCMVCGKYYHPEIDEWSD